MTPDRNRATVDALISAINRNDRNALDDVFTNDVIMDWPQSGERIRGAQNRRDEMRDGLIARETAYWAKPFPAPEWRAPWVEAIS